MEGRRSAFGKNMRLLSAIVVGSCLSLPSAALPWPQQDTPPAATSPTQQAPYKESAPQGDKPSPQDSKPEAKPETNTENKTEQQGASQTEPQSTTDAQQSTVGSQGTSESSPQPKADLQKKANAAQLKARTKAPANGKRTPAASAPAPSGAPRRIVVREGGASEPETQIVSNLTHEEASRERQSTEDLLNLTRDILQRLSGRSLDAQRQETLSQIQNYMEGSRSALKQGDIARAHTLALKANLLADDLASH